MSDDESLDSSSDHNYNQKSYIPKSKPSKSFFGSTANDEDVYDFDFNEVEETRNTDREDYPTHFSPSKSQKNSSNSSKISKSNVNTGETAMEKAQNMLNKYGKGATGKS
eukprot:CAMPEP_0119048840 /NCGR_PEP_ID=MMETSP1177-20130426/61363_1 /TAXON_ID=2985 /ORGANISM="Ochromonas sp, Strain CCMP1899" /LENGTH=108 /DNA_ID=CAMNT_0007025279 /DNA_START=44 /DNA_END=367 /DNA_ORIENTATION=-